MGEPAPAENASPSGRAIGFLIYSPRGFSTDSQALMLEVKRYSPFVAITKVTTMSGKLMEIKSGQRPLFIPFPTYGHTADPNKILSFIGACRSRYPQFAQALDTASMAWKKARDTADSAPPPPSVAGPTPRQERKAGTITFTLTDGKLIENALVLGAGKSGLRVMTDTSVTTIPAESLPHDMLVKYGYPVPITGASLPPQPTPGVVPLAPTSKPPQVAQATPPQVQPVETTPPPPPPPPSGEAVVAVVSAPPVVAPAPAPPLPDKAPALLARANEVFKKLGSKPAPPHNAATKEALKTLKTYFLESPKTGRSELLSASGLFEFLGNNTQDYHEVEKLVKSPGETTTVWEMKHPSKLRVLYTVSGESLSEVEMLMDRTYFETYMPDLVPSVIAPIAKPLLSAADGPAFLAWLEGFQADLPFESNQGVTLTCGLAELSKKKLNAQLVEDPDAGQEYVSIKIKTPLSKLADTRKETRIPREVLGMGDDQSLYLLTLACDTATPEAPGRWKFTLSCLQGGKDHSKEKMLLSGFDLAQYQETTKSLDEVAEWAAVAAGKKVQEGNRDNPLFKLFLKGDKSFAVWHKDLTKVGKPATPEAVLRPKDIFALRWLLAHAGDAVDAYLGEPTEPAVTSSTPAVSGE